MGICLSRNAKTPMLQAHKMEVLHQRGRVVCTRKGQQAAVSNGGAENRMIPETSMKRLLVVLIGCAFCATAGAQTTAPATDAATTKAETNKAKQEMVQGTTKAATVQSSTAPYKGTKAPSHAQKKTKEQQKEAMAGVSKSAGSQYGTTAGQQAAAAKKDAPKAEKLDMSDPKVQEAMRKQKP